MAGHRETTGVQSAEKLPRVLKNSAARHMKHEKGVNGLPCWGSLTKGGSS